MEIFGKVNHFWNLFASEIYMNENYLCKNARMNRSTIYVLPWIPRLWAKQSWFSFSGPTSFSKMTRQSGFLFYFLKAKSLKGRLDTVILQHKLQVPDEFHGVLYIDWEGNGLNFPLEWKRCYNLLGRQLAVCNYEIRKGRGRNWREAAKFFELKPRFPINMLHDHLLY